jgi:glutamine cyclotransferase
MSIAIILSKIRSRAHVAKTFGLLMVSSLLVLGCEPTTTNPANSHKKTPIYGYEVVKVYPHDTESFTQGLVWNDGRMLESTGEVGHSSLRRVDVDTGKPMQKVDVPPPYFAEGLALLNGKLYQLTWQHQLGFVYDALSFDRVGQFNYNGEGWGLTTDGTSLILSDGSNRLRFLNPDNFQVTKTIAVVDGPTPIQELNELEYVKGEIYANVWHANRIARINPETGAVVGWIDLTGLLSSGEVTDDEAVLNGIAYDATNDRLFVTGKLWPKLFEIKLVAK